MSCDRYTEFLVQSKICRMLFIQRAKLETHMLQQHRNRLRGNKMYNYLNEIIYNDDKYYTSHIKYIHYNTIEI